MISLTPHVKKGRLVRGALLTLLLASCAHQQTTDIYAQHITPQNLADTTSAVVESTMPPNDKTAFTEMVAQHRKSPQDLSGKTVREMILEEQAYRIGQHLAKQEQVNEAAHDRAIDKLMLLDVPAHKEQEHQIIVTMRVQNKSTKTIESLDCGIIVADRKGARIGMAEFDFDRKIAPHQTLTFDHAIRYVTFGPDAGSMRLAYQRPKTVEVDVKKIHFADGTEAGYDD